MARPRLAKPFTPATPAELDAAARITAGDVHHAAETWERDAPTAFSQLLNATPIRTERSPRRKKSIDSAQ